MGNEYIEVRKEYVERVRRELLGPGSEVCIPDAEHELISSAPNVRYSIGILFPQKQRLIKEELPSGLTPPQVVCTETFNSNSMPMAKKEPAVLTAIFG